MGLCSRWMSRSSSSSNASNPSPTTKNEIVAVDDKEEGNLQGREEVVEEKEELSPFLELLKQEITLAVSTGIMRGLEEEFPRAWKRAKDKENATKEKEKAAAAVAEEDSTPSATAVKSRFRHMGQIVDEGMIAYLRMVRNISKAIIIGPSIIGASILIAGILRREGTDHIYKAVTIGCSIIGASILIAGIICRGVTELEARIESRWRR